MNLTSGNSKIQHLSPRTQPALLMGAMPSIGVLRAAPSLICAKLSPFAVRLSSALAERQLAAIAHPSLRLLPSSAEPCSLAPWLAPVLAASHPLAAAAAKHARPARPPASPPASLPVAPAPLQPGRAQEAEATVREAGNERVTESDGASSMGLGRLQGWRQQTPQVEIPYAWRRGGAARMALAVGMLRPTLMTGGRVAVQPAHLHPPVLSILLHRRHERLLHCRPLQEGFHIPVR